ncbi:MAG: sugar ABC transporter permease [Symbiobacterium sp.]|uniref:carbohydrate ABC transporter permease n=1 Tax=Symbiobacterium sp. TaxID=1971213 RepID=UPI003464142F
MRRGRNILAYGLLSPAFLVVVLFLVYPLFLAVNLSLRAGQTMNLSQINSLPLSLVNYAEVLSDPATWHSVWKSVEYTGLSVGISFLIGLGTALVLNRKFPGRRILRTLVLLPWAVPGVVTVLGFLWILDSSYGVMNYLLRSLHLISTDVAWFADPSTAMIAVVIPTVWKGYPFFTLMLLAALQSIPGDLYEAARVDGAGSTQLFRFITWPGIRTTATLAIVLQVLWVFREFDYIYATTGGGPVGATETLAIRIYNEAFGYFHMTTASALGMLTVLICGLVVFMAYPVLRKEFF